MKNSPLASNGAVRMYFALVLMVFGFVLISTSSSGCNGSSSATPTPEGGETIEPDPEGTLEPEIEATATVIAEESGDFTLDREALSFDHTVAESDCPQNTGSIIVTSTFPDPTNFTVAVDGPLSTSVTDFSLESGTTQEVTVLFTCAQATSFTGSVDVTANGETKSVQVNGNVTGP